MKMEFDTQLFRQALSVCTDGLAIVDARQPHLPLIYVNPAYERLTGYSAGEILGRNSRFLQLEDNDQAGLDVVRAAIAKQESCVVTLRNYRKDGSPFWNELSLAPILDSSGKLTHFFAQLTDVSERVATEAKLLTRHKNLLARKRELELLALRDGLTGLYNRRAFDEQLEREWNRARRDHAPLSVIMIDIDHFKRFNDTFGHPAGDQCIQAVAGIVQRCFARGSDLVARYGGDEFVVLASAVTRKQVQHRADQLHEAVKVLSAQPAGSLPSPVTLSVGVATAIPLPRKTPSDLLDAADRALYQYKRRQRERMSEPSTPNTNARRLLERLALVT
ncbi:MAG: diguanylate cyclase [Betaproteobacteria bacterium]